MNAKSKFRRLLSVSGCSAAAVALLSCAAPLERAWAQPLVDNAGAYQVEVLVDGEPAPRYFHAGQSYVLGHRGERYTLRIRNGSFRRVEAVVSVDGRDVIDGKPADFRKRGYLVPAGGFVDIDGWRLSERQVAAFRFTSVADSYAGRTGGARHVGVIGVAVFPERRHRPAPFIPTPLPDHRYRDRSGRGPIPAEPQARGESSAPAPAAPKASRSADEGIAQSERAPSARPGLGTQFGESLHAPVQEVSFLRENERHPSLLLGLRYNDRGGLLALGIDVDGHLGVHGQDDAWLRGTADPFPVSHRRYAAPPSGWRR
jgi:hypothetical protein